MKFLRYAFIGLLLSCYSPLSASKESEEVKDKVCQILPTLEGWCSKEKAQNFFDLVLEVKPKLCVEIGVFGGASIFPVASALQYLDSGIVVGIDPWDKIEAIKYVDPVKDAVHLEWWGKINFNFLYYKYLNMLSRYNLEDYCITKKTTSEKAAAEFADGSIDILYIDGNLGQIAATKDAELFLPKVRQGGFIWLNDITWEKTARAAELLEASCDVIKTIDNGNCTLFRKKAA